MNRSVFISGALTAVGDADSVKAGYEQVGGLCERLGWSAYVPHLHTDPIAHPDVSCCDVYETDRLQVTRSGLVIANVSIPSFGTGQEIQIASQTGVPVVLLCKKGRPLSRMTRGTPGVIAEIWYDSLEDALAQLSVFLSGLPMP